MCEVTLYMEAATACHGISVIYHTLQCFITYIPWRGALIFTSSVLHIFIYICISYKILLQFLIAKVKKSCTDMAVKLRIMRIISRVQA